MTRIYRVSTLVIVLLSITFLPSSLEAIGLAKIKVVVIDESGSPIEGAHLNVRFSSDSGTVKGVTDDYGIFETKAISNDGVILGDITREGYYESGIAHSFYVTRFGMWQPWEKELTVVMRPIINPVPMYEVDKFFELPLVDQEVGFDLMKADWVIPYGQGTHADFIFKVKRLWDNVDNFDATMILTFSNSHDGIQLFKDDGGGDFNVGSSFRLPRTARESGYQSMLKKRTSAGAYGRHWDHSDSSNYIFRVRSEVDENGNLKRAMYGKIYGDLKFSPGSISIGMNYYFNPDYTRNLEFDYNKNLFNQIPVKNNPSRTKQD